MSDPTASPILIAGPTASGKSALALALAEETGGLIINADALQVYADLAILTARPSAADMARAPHALYGHVLAADAYSVGRYVRDVARALADARTRGLRPIIVGGTGLYFKALLEGLSPIPEIAADVRAHWRMEAQRIGAAGLHDELKRRDAEMAQRLRPSDTQRLTRALEVLDSTGRSLSHWQSVPGVPVLAEPSVRLLMGVETDELKARCEVRFEQMMEAGALEEVRRLVSLRLDAALPIFGALGVTPLVQHLQGATTLEAAVARAKVETWQYVKRQKTWVKRNMMSWNIVHKEFLEINDRSIMHIIENLRSLA